MKTAKQVAIFIFWCVSIATHIGYACGIPPDIYISNYVAYRNPGDSFYFTADLIGGWSVEDWWWTPEGSPDGMTGWSEYSDYSTGSGSFSSLGEHYVYAYGRNDYGTDSDWARVWVIDLDMEIVSDYVAVGDLVQVNLSWEPSEFPGCFELKTTPTAGGHHIRVWKNQEKTISLISEATGTYVAPVYRFPSTVWIEGVVAGGNATLYFNYRPNCSQTVYPITGSHVQVCVAELKMLDPSDVNGNGLIDDPFGNEFSFDASDPGVLQITCHAQQCLCLDPELVLWTIEDIGSIRGVWNPHVPGDLYTGQGYSSMVTFTGMPANNSDFGRKVITLCSSVLPQTDQETIEVFFEPLATNNLGDGSNNTIPSTVREEDVVIRMRR